MNNSEFVLAGDGWVQVTPCGEFPHVGAGVTQVIDREACDRIAANFNGRKSDTNFPGVLVDFDHFSLDTEKSSEAAGWISDLESRDTGLWARVRWSDAGLAAVQGGRFRLMSPVFPAPEACEDLGGGKIRPVRLVSVALTNEPNIRGGRPLANRKTEDGGRRTADGGEAPDGATTNKEGARGGSETRSGKDKAKGDVLSGPGAKKFMWLLGVTESGKHCPVCLERDGQVKTLMEWLRAGSPPCRCKCRLAEVGKEIEDGGRRSEDGEVANRWAKPWGDKARAASLAVRRAKARARLAARAADGTASTFDRVVKSLDDGLAAASAGVPEDWDGPSISSGGRAPDGPSAFLADTTPTLREVVGAGAESGVPFVDAVNAAFGAAALLGGVTAGAGRKAGGGARPRRLAALGEWFRARTPGASPGSAPSLDAAALKAVEAAKEGFRARQQSERDALAGEIRRLKGVRSGDGLEGLPAKMLRDILTAAGGVPSRVPDANAPSAALRELVGKSPALRARAAAEEPDARAVRSGFAEFLRESIPPRALGVDSHVRELRALSEAAGRAYARAREELYGAQHALRESKPGTPAHAKAVRDARAAEFDLGFSLRASQEYGREAARVSRSVEDYLRSVREGNPLNWDAGDADYEAVWRGVRETPEAFYSGVLGNRAAAGWQDAARAASLAVRRAKAAARRGLEDFGRRLRENREATGKAGEAYQEGLRRGGGAAEKDTGGAAAKSFAPYRDADGDLVVDGTLTILKGTPPEKVGEILRRHGLGAFVDRAIESDSRIRAAAARKARISAERYGGATEGMRDKAWRAVVETWMCGENGGVGMNGTRWKRQGTRGSRAGGAVGNRWSDAARSASLAARRAKYGSGWANPGWSDAARAAALAVRREKAALRQAQDGTAPGGTYSDGTPVVRDLVSEVSDSARSHVPGQAHISDAAPFEERQRQYAEAFRQWWNGVEATAGNIGEFHAYVAALGGAAAAAAGAARPAGVASGAFGARYGGQKPVYDTSGNVVGWAKVGGRPAAARRSARPAREIVTADPLNNPKTGADLAVRESYERHLDALRSGYESGMAAKGLDPQGYPPAGGGALRGLVPAAVAEAMDLYGRLSGMPVRTAGDREVYGAAAEGLRRFGELYESDMLERAEKEGILPKVRALLDGGSLGGPSRGSAARESATGYTDEELPWFAAPPGVVREGAAAYGGGLSAGAAREAARALGMLHGAYGVGEDGVEIPEALLADYETGRAEGAKGYDYGVVPPRDRAAVLRGARAYLDGAVGEDEGYAPDHLNDRYNLADWDSAASWATRNQGKNAVYDPRTPDTRGQYSPAGLMRTAMEWFGDAMARGDRGESNAALSYMGDLLASVAADRRSALDVARGGGEEAAGEGEEAEIDASMPEYDADGVEVGGEPFFEDSHADPAALPPWWRLLGNRWSDAARAAALAVRRAKAAARRAAEGAQAAGPLIFQPLAHPGMNAGGDALEDYLERKRRREAGEARKAADKARLREERGARRERRGASLKEKFDGPGLKEKFGQPGLREKFREADDKVDRGRLKDNYAKSGPAVPAQGFSVPESGAVFYYDGNFYDSKGKWISKAAASPKSGAVWRNGMWYDAATGKTLGRTVAES